MRYHLGFQSVGCHDTVRPKEKQFFREFCEAARNVGLEVYVTHGAMLRWSFFVVLVVGRTSGLAPLVGWRALPDKVGAFRVSLASTKVTETDCGVCDSWSPFSENCKPCADGSVEVNGQVVTPRALREVEVLNTEGESQQLLSVVGEDKSVVVFLRHLA